MKYISRAQEKLVERYSDLFKVVVVTGPRQVGKTTMLRHLIQAEKLRGVERAYVSLDNTAVRMVAKEDPALFLQRYRAPVLIDEIQYAPELLPYIKLAVDESDANGQYWLTGSQPFHLMKAVSESLAGRAGIIEMLGLSNAEIAGVENEAFDPSPEYFERRVKMMPSMDVVTTFERISRGSFPGIALLPDDMRHAGFESLVDTYLMRDIRDLAQVGDELKFRRFMQVCASLTGRPVVYAELGRMADIDAKTAKTWLSLLVSSYLVKVVHPYSNNILKRLSKQPVLHFLDTGLAAHLAGWDSPKALERGAFSGHIFETYAFGEVYKSFANEGMRPPLHFFRTNDKKEIDLLMERDGVLFPIEVKKTASPRADDAKNIGALDAIASDSVPTELASFKRVLGCGCVLCLADSTFPVSRRAWAFPIWAV